VEHKGKSFGIYIFLMMVEKKKDEDTEESNGSDKHYTTV